MKKSKKQMRLILVVFGLLFVLGIVIYFSNIFTLSDIIGDNYILLSEGNNTFSCSSGTVEACGTGLQYGYNKCSLGKWNGYTELYYEWDCSGSGSTVSERSRSYIEDNELAIKMKTYGGAASSVIYTVDNFKGKYFRANLEFKTTTSVNLYISLVSNNISYNKFNNNIPIFEYHLSSTGVEETDFGLLSIEPSFLNKDIINVYWKGIFYNTYNISSQNESRIYITVSGGSVGNPSGTAIIKYPRFNYEFSCQFKPDDVVIVDSFDGGNNINISSLSNTPLKFCIDEYPSMLRNFSQGVKQDVRGDIPNKLVRNENINIPQGLMLDVFYIIDYKEGVTTRCPLGSAWNIKNQTCRKVVFEAEDIINVIRDTRYVTITNEQTSFNSDINIGDLKIDLNELKYNCDASTGYTAPQPKPECWSTVVNYNNKVYNFIDNQELDLDNYFKLKFYAKGRYDEGIKQIKEAETIFVLTLKNRDFLDSKHIISNTNLTNEYYILFGSSKPLKFEIFNNLTNFNALNSGINVKIIRKMVYSEDIIEKQFELKMGKNEYSIDVDTSQLGEIFYEITPFIKINSIKFLDNKALIYNYAIVDKIPSNTTLIYINNTIERNITVEKNITFTEYLNNTIYQNVTVYVNKTTKGNETTQCIVCGFSKPTYFIIGFGVVLFIVFIVFISRKRHK